MEETRNREEELCERLFSLTSSGERSADLQGLLSEMYPLVRRLVRRQCRNRVPHDSAYSWEDVAQDVFLRLQQKPPHRRPRLNPHVSFLAWVKRTTANYLVDLERKRPPGGQFSLEEEHRPGGNGIGRTVFNVSDGRQSAEERLEILSERDSILHFIRERYPRGARYLELRQENPYASVFEIAEAMGVSRAYLDKIAQRTRQHAKEYSVRQQVEITSGKTENEKNLGLPIKRA